LLSRSYRSYDLGIKALLSRSYDLGIEVLLPRYQRLITLVSRSYYLVMPLSHHSDEPRYSLGISWSDVIVCCYACLSVARYLSACIDVGRLLTRLPAPGQVIAFYDGEECLGSAVILAPGPAVDDPALLAAAVARAGLAD